eukprot:scaffold383_cov101-Isochrysis_galbana.AAC.3
MEGATKTVTPRWLSRSCAILVLGNARAMSVDELMSTSFTRSSVKNERAQLCAQACASCATTTTMDNGRHHPAGELRESGKPGHRRPRRLAIRSGPAISTWLPGA